MSTTDTTPSAEVLLLERLRAATETLELVAADRGTLALLSEDEHRRLRAAAALVCNPDVRARRTMAKALARRRRREESERDEVILAATGIRTLRRSPVFTTPNIFAPREFEPRDLAPAADAEESPGADPAAPGETSDPRCCYICKQKYSTIHHFYDRLCPSCGELNFAKRSELADLRGRVALLTGGRVKIGYQAGLKLLRSGRTSSSRPGSHATRRRATHRSPTLRRGAIVWRSTVWISVTRRASRRSARSCSRPATAST